MSFHMGAGDHEMNDDAARNHDTTRRIFLKKMAYIPPTVLTMSAVASLASAASGGRRRRMRWMRMMHW